MNANFIFILIIILMIIIIIDQYENFSKTDNNNEKNLFFSKLPNIYFTKQFIDNLFVPPKPPTRSLNSINANSYINSNTVSNKIICSSINNQAKCWDNNNCQWINKIGEKPYCTLAPKLL